MWQYERDADLEIYLPVVTNNGDGDSSIRRDAVEVDFIQEALQQSSINLDANFHINMEDDLEMFEHVDLSVSNLTTSDNSITTPATCEDIQTDSPIIPYPEFVIEEEPLCGNV